MSLIFAPSALKFVRGTTWSDTIQIVDDTGAPIDLTGVVDILLRVRASANSPTAIIELSMTNWRIGIVNALTGTISITVSAADTLLFPANNQRKARYVYDCVLDKGGTPKVIEPAFKGKVTVYPQITRVLNET